MLYKSKKIYEQDGKFQSLVNSKPKHKNRNRNLSGAKLSKIKKVNKKNSHDGKQNNKNIQMRNHIMLGGSMRKKAPSVNGDPRKAASVHGSPHVRRSASFHGGPPVRRPASFHGVTTKAASFHGGPHVSRAASFHVRPHVRPSASLQGESLGVRRPASFISLEPSSRLSSDKSVGRIPTKEEVLEKVTEIVGPKRTSSKPFEMNVPKNIVSVNQISLSKEKFEELKKTLPDDHPLKNAMFVEKSVVMVTNSDGKKHPVSVKPIVNPGNTSNRSKERGSNVSNKSAKENLQTLMKLSSQKVNLLQTLKSKVDNKKHAENMTKLLSSKQSEIFGKDPEERKLNIKALIDAIQIFHNTPKEEQSTDYYKQIEKQMTKFVAMAEVIMPKDVFGIKKTVTNKYPEQALLEYVLAKNLSNSPDLNKNLEQLKQQHPDLHLHNINQQIKSAMNSNIKAKFEEEAKKREPKNKKLLELQENFYKPSRAETTKEYLTSKQSAIFGNNEKERKLNIKALIDAIKIVHNTPKGEQSTDYYKQIQYQIKIFDTVVQKILSPEEYKEQTQN